MNVKQYLFWELIETKSHIVFFLESARILFSSREQSLTYSGPNEQEYIVLTQQDVQRKAVRVNIVA